MQANKPLFFDSISNPSYPWSSFWEDSLYLEGLSDKIGFKKYIYNPELNGLENAPSRPITARTWAINALKISAYLLGLPLLIMVIGKAIHRSFQSYTMVQPKSKPALPKSEVLPEKPIPEAVPVPQPVITPNAPPAPLDRSLLGMARRAKLGELKPDEVPFNIRGFYLTNNSKNKFREFFLEAPTFLIAWLGSSMPNRDDYKWDENTDIPTYQACLRIVIETEHPDRIDHILAFIRSDGIGFSRRPLDDVRKCYYFKTECENLSLQDKVLLKERMTADELKVLTLPVSIDMVQEQACSWKEEVSKKFYELSEEEIQKMRPEWVLEIALDFGGLSQKVDQVIEISTQFKDGPLWLASKFISGMVDSESSNLEEQIKEQRWALENKTNYLKLWERAPNKAELEAFKAYCEKHPLNLSFGRGAHVDIVNLFRKEQTIS